MVEPHIVEMVPALDAKLEILIAIKMLAQTQPEIAGHQMLEMNAVWKTICKTIENMTKTEVLLEQG